MDAIALTDHGVMSGAIKFYRQAKKREIKPIIGCEIYVAPRSRRDRGGEAGERFYHLVLLAENGIGYRNLLKIVSYSHTEGFYYRPRADKELLREYADGLIALSACQSGEVPRLLLSGRTEKAEEAAKELEDIFGRGNFFIELQHHGTERDDRLKEGLISLARRLDLPLVATNDIHYLYPEDKLAHEVLLNIRAGKTLNDPDHRTFEGDGYHFRSAEEMEELFADVPEALENTRLIADRCNIELEFGRSMIPPFELPEGESDPNEYLRRLAYAGAEDRYGRITSEVRERLDYELDVIARMEYSTYFLIVWDFVRYAKENGIAVGPGRGSAAGSLVAYSLGITGVDPLKYNLIFERFLNPDRVSMPDFDIDFCIKGRDRVIEYVRKRYGGEKWWERIAQIATYDRMAARSVVRDVGRVLGVPYSVTDRVAKLIPFGWGLSTAVDRVVELRTLYEENTDIRRVIDIGIRLEGLARNASTHAAGVVIAPDELTNHVPLLRVGEGEFVTQYDMIDVEAVGLLKFDFLGLRNLTLLDETCRSIEEETGVEITLEEIPLDDERTFSLIRSGKTAGIFQLEGSGITKLIKRVAPDRFEDLVAILALFRPGPLESGMTDEYVERRNGNKRVSYPHPALEEVLSDTYGLPIYQDQVMLMAQRLASFTLAEADILRKAMGKKKKDIMASLREKFIAGCLKNGLSRELAEATFGDMEKFSRYGFNKAHATAYAFVSYWTAYLKANYPTHFMASLLSSVSSDTDKIAEYIGECRDMRIEVLPPDINESRSEFTPVEEGKIRFGLGAIKHVGRGAIRAIISARDKGRFTSFFDMCRRVEGETIDRDALEALIKAGAFDRLGASRRGLLRHLSEGMELMQVAQRERATGQRSIFEGLGGGPTEPEVDEPEFDRDDLLALEKEFLGLYVSGHPLDQHRQTLNLRATPARQVRNLPKGARATIGGWVKKIRRINTKRGDQMAFVTIDDGTGELEFTVFPRLLALNGDLLRDDALVGVDVSANERNGGMNLVAEEIFPLGKISSRRGVFLTVVLDPAKTDEAALKRIREALSSSPGDVPVRFKLVNEAHSVAVSADRRYAITPSDSLRESLLSLELVVAVYVGNGTES